jgi:hypothetical protein
LGASSDPAEVFVREVDENLRRDQLRDAAKSYGKWIIALLILLSAAVGGYLYWQDRQQKQAVEQGEGPVRRARQGWFRQCQSRPAELAPLAGSSNDVVHASAELAQAALALRQKIARPRLKSIAGWPPITACRRPIVTCHSPRYDDRI